MSIGKRILSLLLSAVLMVSCIPAIGMTVYAEENEDLSANAAVTETNGPQDADAQPVEEEYVSPDPSAEPEETLSSEETIQETESADTFLSQQLIIPFQLNPRYAGILEASDFTLADPVPARIATYASYLSMDAAAQQFRDYMKTRADTITINFASTESDPGTAAHLLFDKALEHTGNPLEGDYLAWQYGGWNASISYRKDGNTYYYSVTYSMSYYTTAAQEAQLDAAVESLLSSLNPTGTDYEKIRTIYDYMCANITYDYDNLYDDSYKLKYSAYAALVNGTSVCQGYANLLYRLALELGIDCRLISGIGNGGGHGWNIIGLEGKYYNADATWDSNYAGSDNYPYFLKCDANFHDHYRDEEYATTSFYAAYPMGETDYDPGSSGNGDSGIFNQARFEAELAAAYAAGQAYTLNQPLTLESSMEIPAGYAVNLVAPGKITVPSDVCLTVTGTLAAMETTEIVIGSDGCMQLDGSLFLCGNSTLTVESGGILYVDGALYLQNPGVCMTTQDDALVLINGTAYAAEGCTLNIAPATVTTELNSYASISGMDGLVYALSAPDSCYDLPSLLASGKNYVAHIMFLEKSMTLMSSVTIPRNTILSVSGAQTVIAIPAGSHLANSGHILLNDNSTLLAESGGVLTNRGTITGNVIIEGTLIDNARDDLAYTAANISPVYPDEIRAAVQDMGADAVAAELASSADSIRNLAILENYVGGSVPVIIDGPLGFTADQVHVVGANLNTPVSDAGIALVITAGSNRTVPAEYGNTCLLSFSSALTGVANPQLLEVPARITLPVPESADARDLVLLHQNSDGTLDVIHHDLHSDDGITFISFVLTGSADYLLAGTVPVDVPAGDLDGDNQVTDSDVEYLLWHTLFPDLYPVFSAADFDGNGSVNDADVEYLLWHTLFPELYPLG